MTTITLLQHRVITPEGCWNYTGAVNGGKCGGYGTIYAFGKMRLVHRLAYSMFKGKLKRGKVVAHQCHNRLCFNPDHLKQTTQRRNLLDGVKLGTVRLFEKR